MTERKSSSVNFNSQWYLESRSSLNELLHLLSKRWLTEVLFSIEDGHNHFSTIKEDLEYISDTILTDRLQSLLDYGLINKITIQDSIVEYHITDIGAGLSGLLDTLNKFGESNIAYIKDEWVAA